MKILAPNIFQPPNVHHRAKSYGDRPNRSWDTTIFQFSKWRVAVILRAKLVKFITLFKDIAIFRFSRRRPSSGILDC